MSTSFESVPDPQAPGYTIPWERDLGERPLQATWETWRQSVFEPASFFRASPPRGPLGYAIGYAVVFSLIGALFTLLWRLLAAGLGLRLGAGTGGLGPVAGPLVEFFVTPFATVIGLFLWVAVVHLVLMALGAAAGGFRATFRAHAYAAGPAVFQIVPVLGTVVGGIWSIVLAIIGIREMHGTDTWRAVLAVLLPLAIFLVIAVVIVIAAAALGLLLL